MGLHSLIILTISTYDSVYDSVTKSINITTVLLFIVNNRYSRSIIYLINVLVISRNLKIGFKIFSHGQPLQNLSQDFVISSKLHGLFRMLGSMVML